MRYRSTRGGTARPLFSSILLEGLAAGGGLYVPEAWPLLRPANTYPRTVAAALTPFVAPDPLVEELGDLTEDAFAGFRHPDILPLRDMGHGRYLLELFWGPTLAFKDHALQTLGRLFDRALRRQDRHVTVLGATSGDTGSAAIAACSGLRNLDIIILYPADRVSEFQRRQMTTVADANVRAVAVAGTFDDCQALVKRAFADPALGVDLVAVNSINFARVVAQTAYYLWATELLGAPELDFSVPTGNFGNVFAGWVARRGRAPIGRLVIANNANKALSDLVSTGTFRADPVDRTLSPSMDIGLPSNLERYLYELAGAEQVAHWQADLRQTGAFTLDQVQHQALAQDFAAGWADDDEALTVIKSVYEERGVLLDPHTAVGWSVAMRHERRGVPMVVLATADPVKFADAVRTATGVEPQLPAEFAQLPTTPERVYSLPNDFEALVSLLAP